MTRDEFLQLMHFPIEWDTLGMYPQELFEGQVGMYKPGDERGAEHDRNGAFHWWLRRGPTKLQVEKLRQLASLDPDPFLGQHMLCHLDDPTLPPAWTARD